MEKFSAAQIIDEGRRRDRRGRVTWPKQRRLELLAEYACSGMSQAAFARRCGVRYPTFAHWVQEARRESRGLPEPKHKVEAPHFAEVCLGAANPVASAAAAAELSVTLPGGLVARGVDAVGLAALVRALLARD